MLLPSEGAHYGADNKKAGPWWPRMNLPLPAAAMVLMLSLQEAHHLGAPLFELLHVA